MHRWQTLLPTHGRQFPDVIPLAHDVVAWNRAMMIAKEQRPGGKFYFNTRMWVKRDARWQMLFSLNTQIE